MSREIKFRVWTGTHWLKPMELAKQLLVGSGPENYGQFSYGYYEMSQYTGFHDRINTEIYENDIVSDGSRSFSVVWSDNMCWMYLQSTNSQQTASLSIKTAPSLEVIGNKYENPELLTA